MSAFSTVSKITKLLDNHQKISASARLKIMDAVGGCSPDRLIYSGQIQTGPLASALFQRFDPKTGEPTNRPLINLTLSAMAEVSDFLATLETADADDIALMEQIDLAYEIVQTVERTRMGLPRISIAFPALLRL